MDRFRRHGDVDEGRLRIVLTHAYSWPETRRGGERYLHELGHALGRAGHDVRIVTTGAGRADREVLGVPVTYLRRHRLAERRFGDQALEAGFGCSAALHLAGRTVDVWHALGPHDALAAIGSSRLRSRRTVFTNLGVPWRWYWETRGDGRVHELVALHVDRYVCLSASAASALEESYGREATVLPGGVDVRCFAPANRREPRPTILYSGALDEPRKRVDLLLESFETLLDTVPEAQLWLSGPGDASEVCSGASRRVQAATTLLPLGLPSDQPMRYGRAWITVLPSLFEAFGLTLVESLACGTPIVAVRGSGGPAEIVRPGVGCLGDDSAEGLAAACAEALELSQSADSVEACRSEADRYDWSTSIVPRMEALYRS